MVLIGDGLTAEEGDAEVEKEHPPPVEASRFSIWRSGFRGQDLRRRVLGSDSPSLLTLSREKLFFFHSLAANSITQMFLDTSKKRLRG